MIPGLSIRLIIRIAVSVIALFSIPAHGQKEDINNLLVVAAFDGDINRCDSLLKAGADVNTITPEGITPLMYASQNGHIQVVSLLIDYGALINAKPFDGVTALIAASRANKTEVAELLIRNNAELNVTDYYGGTPLIYASAFNLDTLVDMLLYYDADVNFRSKADSCSALHIAALTGGFDIAINLLDHGADVNANDIYGYTPLMIASQNNDTAMLKLLLSNKADAGSKDFQGYNSLHIAAQKDYPDIAGILLSFGSDPDQPAGNNLSPLKIARLNESYRVSKILRKAGSKHVFLPAFNKIIFSFDTNFSIDDIFMGGRIGLSDANYKTSYFLGFSARLKAAAILKKENDSLYFQFLENRSFFTAGIEKRFNIIKSNKNSKGIYLGLNEIFTYGRYHGTGWSPANKFITVPLAGIFINWKYFGVKMNYEYLDFKTENISPHRINLSLWCAINLVKNKYKDKVADWL